MGQTKQEMVISNRWFQAAVLTFLIGFSILGYLAYRIYGESPPVPATVVTPQGNELFSAADIMGGQHIFQKYGLMQYGTIFGHGAYLGPDFTAQYLHRAGLAMLDFHRRAGRSEAEAAAAVQEDFKRNAFDRPAGRLAFTAGQVYAFERMRDFYHAYFAEPVQQQGLKRPAITNPQEIRRLTSFFAWAAWVASAVRPGQKYSYTNNWPPEPLAANSPTPEALLWSVLSLIALLGGAGLLFFFIGRYDLLGWHRAETDRTPYDLAFRTPEKVGLTRSQRATAWYFLVVAGLFLTQGLLGGLNAHYHVEPDSFYGIPIDSWIPYNLSRMWHLQLALFFTSSAYLAMGIFLAPMIAGREPRYQSALAIALFGALVLVVVGSLLGEAAGIKNYITSEGPWFWLGAQGWEFLDLGRLWQILLLAGMIFWVVIIFRGLKSTLQREHHGNMPWLFLYSALSIPLFYAAGMVFWKEVNYTIMDFWRFWVVHLWVEDFLELFTTIMVAYLFVLLGVVRISVATRIVYLDVILYSIGGVVGTMHHLYFEGAPAMYMALGAFFSAMEVIPLLLLTFEAWRFMRLGAPSGDRSVLQASAADFPHKWSVMFLVAVGFWNFLGAGVFGFLINLPFVSYYEIGTQFTANHAHGAMMGVYGMLAIAFFMFVARYFIPADRASNRAMAVSFWSLNIGLLLMIFVNLIPMGILQLYDAVANGYWHAREPEFFQSSWVKVLEWLRLPGDTIFIVGGILPVVYLAVRMFANRNRGEMPLSDSAEQLTRIR
ncbi:MAG: nitric-oxide reductase large subunit [Desulfobacteraceae bacterium]|nr:MAG: nitric-oxide reductase large subunit [Desulfobacteraceae bacterium]